MANDTKSLGSAGPWIVLCLVLPVIIAAWHQFSVYNNLHSLEHRGAEDHATLFYGWVGSCFERLLRLLAFLFLLFAFAKGAILFDLISLDMGEKTQHYLVFIIASSISLVFWSVGALVYTLKYSGRDINGVGLAIELFAWIATDLCAVVFWVSIWLAMSPGGDKAWSIAGLVSGAFYVLFFMFRVAARKVYENFVAMLSEKVLRDLASRGNPRAD